MMVALLLNNKKAKYLYVGCKRSMKNSIIKRAITDNIVCYDYEDKYV